MVCASIFSRSCLSLKSDVSSEKYSHYASCATWEKEATAMQWGPRASDMRLWIKLVFFELRNCFLIRRRWGMIARHRYRHRGGTSYSVEIVGTDGTKVRWCTTVSCTADRSEQWNYDGLLGLGRWARVGIERKKKVEDSVDDGWKCGRFGMVTEKKKDYSRYCRARWTVCCIVAMCMT